MRSKNVQLLDVVVDDIFEVYELVHGVKHLLHSTSVELDALEYASRFSDCSEIYISRIVSSNSIYRYV